jgi:hypothetical protein
VRSLVLACLLALPGYGGSAEQAAAIAPPVELRVLRGRANLLRGSEVVSRSPAAGAMSVVGPLELELGPGSQAEVLWRGRGSLRVQGPAALSLADTAAQPLEPRVTLLFAGSIELEVRRGTVRLSVGELGELEARRSAVALAELPTGAWSVVHRGGESLRFRPAGLEIAREIRGGTSMRLDAGR